MGGFCLGKKKNYVNCPIPTLIVSAFGIDGNQHFTVGTGEKGQTVGVGSAHTGELASWD